MTETAEIHPAPDPQPALTALVGHALMVGQGLPASKGADDGFDELQVLLRTVGAEIVPTLHPEPDHATGLGSAPAPRPVVRVPWSRRASDAAEQRIPDDGQTALRIRKRRAQNLMHSINDMYVDALRLERSVIAYNEMARSRYPAFYAEIDAVAKKAGLSAAGLMQQVKDSTHAAPSLNSMRSEMHKIAADAELVSARRNLLAMSAVQNAHAHHVSEIVEAMSRDLKPEQIVKIKDALQHGVGRRIDATPNLDAVLPGEPEAPEQAKGGFRRMAETIEKIMESIQKLMSKMGL